MLRVKEEPAATVAIKAEIAHFETADEKRPVSLADASRHLRIGHQVTVMQIVLDGIICRIPLGAMQLRQQHHRFAQGARTSLRVDCASHLPQHWMHVRAREQRVDDTGMVESRRRAYTAAQASQKQGVGIFTAGLLHAQRVQPVAYRVVAPTKYLVKPTRGRRYPRFLSRREGKLIDPSSSFGHRRTLQCWFQSAHAVSSLLLAACPCAPCELRDPR